MLRLALTKPKQEQQGCISAVANYMQDSAHDVVQRADIIFALQALPHTESYSALMPQAGGRPHVEECMNC